MSLACRKKELQLEIRQTVLQVNEIIALGQQRKRLKRKMYDFYRRDRIRESVDEWYMRQAPIIVAGNELFEDPVVAAIWAGFAFSLDTRQ
jgi:hypothetical protein